MLKTVEKTKLSGQVFRQLRDAILSEKLASGKRLPSERELCQQLNVNRSSVREALKRLEQARLIETRHGEGSVVLDFRLNAGFDIMRNLVMPSGEVNPVSVRSIFEFRTLIGPEIARLAAMRIKQPELAEIEEIVAKIESLPRDDFKTLQALDFQFHHTMARASENLALILILNTAKEIYFSHRDFFTVIFKRVMGRRDLYRAIYLALDDGDEAASESLCRELIELGNEAFWESFPQIDLSNVGP